AGQRRRRPFPVLPVLPSGDRTASRECPCSPRRFVAVLAPLREVIAGPAVQGGLVTTPLPAAARAAAQVGHRVEIEPGEFPITIDIAAPLCVAMPQVQ